MSKYLARPQISYCRGWHGWCAAILLPALLAPTVGMPAEDSSIFGLTDVWGEARIGVVSNERQRESTTTDDSRWQQQLVLGVDGYLYHPALLNMRLEGGPLFVQQSIETNASLAKSSDTLWGAAGALDILKAKPYPVSIQFRRSHPSVSTSLSGDYITENTMLGINGRLDKVLIPVNLRWGMRQDNSYGSGQGDIRDEKVKDAFLHADISWRKKDTLLFKLDTTDRISSSGSVGLPITSSTRNYRSIWLNSKNFLGANPGGETILEQSLGFYREQTLVPRFYETRRQNYLGRLSRQFGIDNRLSGFIKHQSNQQRDVNDESLGYGIRFSGRTDSRLRYTGSLDGGRQSGTEIKQDRRSGQGTLSGERISPLGRVDASLTVRGARTDQEARNEWVQVFDETLVLEGTTPVTLANPFVDEFSVVVSNAAGTQVFSEGLDYRLIISADVTSVQRLVDGNILDGQVLRASYQYRSGGTFAYDTKGASGSVGISFTPNARLYANYSKTDNVLISGVPTTPLRDANRAEVGGRVQSRFFRKILVSGEATYVVQDESISPYVGNTVAASIETALAWALKLNLSTGLDRRDLENSPEDVNARWQSLGIGGRIGGGGHLDYRIHFLKDDGGSQGRETQRQVLRYRWAFRDLNFDLSFTHLNEMLGGTKREDTNVTAQLWRSF